MSGRGFDLNRETREVRVAGAPVALGARAFDVLAYLEAHSDRVVSKAELLEQVWGGLSVEEGNLTVQISALRKVLGAKAIATVPGVGYKLAMGTSEAPKPEGPALPDTPSLAVLPFANLTGRPEQEYLVDGIVTDLISALSRVSGLFVIAATSSFAFKGQAVDLSEVGCKLGVRYILEGAIQQAGDTLRITVQLAEAENGRTIWSERFGGSTADIFDLQDEITEMVCGVIEPALFEAEAHRNAANPTTSLAAYDLCLQAIPLSLKPRDVGEFRRAVDLLDQAVALDPNYALASAWKCRAYMTARATRWISKDEIAALDPLAERLLRGQKPDPLVLAFAGETRAYLDTDRDAGIRAVRQAVKMNPNSVLILNAAGWTEHYVLNNAVALDHFRRAVRLDPFGHVGANSRQGWAIVEFFEGNYAASVAILEESLADDTENIMTVVCLIIANWHLGRVAEARALVPRLLQIQPGFSRTETLRDIAVRDPGILQRASDALQGAGAPE